MTEVVIPIKSLTEAKSRLAQSLAPGHRKGLVLAMLGDLLAKLANLRQHRVWVVASDVAVFDVARHHGAHCVHEHLPRGYNAAVDLGFSLFDDACNVAVLPCDIPLAHIDDLARLISPAVGEMPVVRIVPDQDRKGTNGLFLSRKNLIRPSFGTGSFARHAAASRAAGVEPDVLTLPGMALDIDTPRDLAAFSARCSQGAACCYVHAIAAASCKKFATSRGAA